MKTFRQVLLAISLIPFLCLTFCSSARTEERPSDSEQALWKLEHSYWQYVHDDNLNEYRSLWHKGFLGWPSVSTTPVRKDHITDWITSQTSKNLSLNVQEFKPAAIQVTGNIAVLCYWLTYKWVDKSGVGDKYTVRVTHTWFKDNEGWRIIGGMSMLETAPASK